MSDLIKADTDLLLKLNDLDSKLNSSLNNAETQTTQDIDRQKAKLQDKIKMLKEKSSELLEETQNKIFLEMTNQTRLREQNLTLLMEIDVKLKNAEDTMNRYTLYEEILSV